MLDGATIDYGNLHTRKEGDLSVTSKVIPKKGYLVIDERSESQQPTYEIT